MKDKFRGWRTVFSFTFRQTTKGTAFKIVSALISFLIIGLIVLVNILAAKPSDDKNVKPSPVNKILVLDQSGFQPADFKALNPELSDERFGHISINNFEGTREQAILAAAKDSTKTLAMIITSSDNGYELEVVIPDGSEITKKQAKKLMGPFSAAFEINKVKQAGIAFEDLGTALSPVVTSYSEVGENTNEIVFVVKLLAPMFFGLMLYIMLLLYGQNVSKSVSTEKTSKLMETLLTSVHPYALIAGKVLAVTSIALLQFISWIVSFIVGLYGGNAIAKYIYPEYQNNVVMVFDFLKDNIGETAMTLPALVIALIFFAVSFLFYCVLAGLAGSFVSKPDDAATTQSIFQLPIIVSWLVCYIASAAGNEGTIRIASFIPFTAPFCVPANLLTGETTPLMGIIALAILSVFTLFVIILSGRIYKGLLLYTGQKINLKMIVNVLKSK